MKQNKTQEKKGKRTHEFKFKEGDSVKVRLGEFRGKMEFNKWDGRTGRVVDVRPERMFPFAVEIYRPDLEEARTHYFKESELVQE